MCKLERKTVSSGWAVTAMGELAHGRASNYAPIKTACASFPPITAIANTDQKLIVPFYGNISKYARQKAVTISVITIDGEDCSMENLGTAADISGGSVEMVDPLDMSTKMANILNRTTLASSVTCKFFLDPSLVLRNEGKGVLNTVTREIGNVTDQTDITFSFDWNEDLVKALENYANLPYDQKIEDKTLDNLRNKKFVFQMQLEYKKPEGGVFTKIITVSKPISSDRNQAENNINATVVALQTIHEGARMAQAGKYLDARINLVSSLRLIQRAMKSPTHQKAYLSYVVQAEKLDQFMRESQTQEAVFGEKDDLARQKARDDASSKAMFQMKTVSVKSFNERR